MRRVILLISLIFASSYFSGLKAIVNSDSQATYTYFQKIENGWHTATIVCFNSNTFTQSRYSLNVQVENNRVIAIDFGNGILVHAGENNSGYVYSDGYLSVDRGFNNNHIIGVSGQVKITWSAGNMIIYDVKIR
jgi:hypothetical protein